MPKLRLSDEEWRRRLSPRQYEVCRRKGTERAFSGAYHDCHTPGVYHCICCGERLFSSSAKFDSGSGWPSFSESLSREALRIEKDRSLGMLRLEVLCDSCGAHLGHVFDDGPAPRGQRFCINSVSLKLEPGAGEGGAGEEEGEKG